MTTRTTGPGHVVVVGGRMTGSAVAASLATRGVAVTVVDAPDPLGDATAASYGWINSHKKHPESYHVLNSAGLEHFHGVLAGVPGVFRATGHVEIAGTDEHVASFEQRSRRLQGLGYGVDEHEPADLARLVPGLAVRARLVRGFPREGIAAPDRLVAHFTATAVAAGARTVGARVDRVHRDGVVLTDGTTIAADAVVVCAGVATGAVTATAGLEVPTVAAETGNVVMGYMATTAPTPAAVDRIVTTDGLNLRPEPGGGMRLQALGLDGDCDPDRAPFDVPAHVTDAFSERLAEVLPAAAGTPLQVRIGRRVIPGDGFPAVGPVDDDARIWTLVTHSGVTLGPWLAERLAEEMLGAPPDPRLAGYSPRRFRASTGEAPAAPRAPGDQ
ncbi:NAD(P)/FAD-dependent oxidoreductase [Pseudonocardia sp. HH130630-07]|uniref:NAD(P)/FAD-dependent oxidoreductase n=1 Tax=Pseudonocardia sp. HH130630-07 TaxID=1690815 RepID=UPI0012EA1B50|nr:FAD-binding oxidoreductase [Pseudonocardia sp. HH130630-07]